MIQKAFLSIFILLTIPFGTSILKAQVFFGVETGAVFTGYNNVRIPGNEGTLFSLKDDLEASAEYFFRLNLGYLLKDRHHFSLLYAPLQTDSKGSFENDVSFAGTNFPANTPTSGTYKFNSYRFTYRYALVHKPKFEFELGLSLKIRDAKIELSTLTLVADKSNVGFVPLISFKTQWNFHERMSLLLDGDALVVSLGRAEDILLALNFDLSENFSIHGGYRILEGGSNGSSVYNFSLFHYASFGLKYMY